MKEANILKILESGEKDFEELKSELNLKFKEFQSSDFPKENRINVGERELKKELKNLARNGSIEKDNDIYKLKVKKTENKKNYIPFVLLALIVILGVYLRIYHIDYPVIGYHNWKETHYITEARNFARDGFFAKGFFVPMVDYPSLYSDPSGAHADTFPLTPILVAIFFMFFGMELWIARLVGILFNIGTIVMMYLVTKKLFNREDISLITALITALLPIFVFFSHNVELVNPAIFFMVSSVYFYIHWRDSLHGRDLLLSLLFFTIATLTKYIFIVIGIPILLTLPFRKFIRKENINLILVSLLILSLIPTWIYYSENTAKGGEPVVTTELLASGISQFQKPGWWDTQKAYVADNYTFIGLFFAFIGLIFMSFSWYKNREFEEKFVLSYFVAFLFFVPLAASKLAGHSYYYYPISPLTIILTAYAIVKIGDFTKKINIDGKEIKHINLIVMIILLVFVMSSMPESFNRQFDTQFPGLDVAGKYLKEHKSSGDRVMHSSHQAFGLLWHADMKGTRGIPSNVGDIKFAEENLNATWLFIYQWDFNIINDKGRWDYIKNHYSLRQIAFLRTEKGIQPIYLLLKKGGTFDDSTINSMLQNKKVSQRDYEYTKGIQRMYYIDIEE